MIYNIITSTPNIFKHIMQENMLSKALNHGFAKIIIWNIKFKKKHKIPK